jgi:hypothetical protein
MTTRILQLSFIAICTASAAFLAAQTETSAPLPDPLVMENGTRVTTASQWRTARRPELLALFTREMYGVAPQRSPKESFTVFDNTPGALNGKAIRKQVTILINGDPNGPKFDMLMYLPKAAKGKSPAILGMNFYGNHAVSSDFAIRMEPTAPPGQNPCPGADGNPEPCRGTNAVQWPLDEMLDKGYAVATFSRLDIDPDTKDGFAKSLKSFYPELQNRPDNFSTIGEWAWAFRRAMDYLETDRAIDAKKVAIFGWSRLGKAALWAGANDERFAAVISNDSGAGGAKLFHRGIAENVMRLNTVFPHWFDQNFRKYNNQDTSMPFDQHELIALIAPRLVYVGSAEKDANADPEGEFESARLAGPVFKLLGKQPLKADHFPPVDHPVEGGVSYHVRTGVHDVLPYDWEQYLKFLDQRMVGRK